MHVRVLVVMVVIVTGPGLMAVGCGWLIPPGWPENPLQHLYHSALDAPATKLLGMRRTWTQCRMTQA